MDNKRRPLCLLQLFGVFFLQAGAATASAVFSTERETEGALVHECEQKAQYVPSIVIKWQQVCSDSAGKHCSSEIHPKFCQFAKTLKQTIKLQYATFISNMFGAYLLKPLPCRDSLL